VPTFENALKIFVFSIIKKFVAALHPTILRNSLIVIFLRLYHGVSNQSSMRITHVRFTMPAADLRANSVVLMVHRHHRHNHVRVRAHLMMVSVAAGADDLLSPSALNGRPRPVLTLLDVCALK
jgi:hypothetical protein